MLIRCVLFFVTLLFFPEEEVPCLLIVDSAASGGLRPIAAQCCGVCERVCHRLGCPSNQSKRIGTKQNPCGKEKRLCVACEARIVKCVLARFLWFPVPNNGVAAAIHDACWCQFGFRRCWCLNVVRRLVSGDTVFLQCSLQIDVA